METADTVNPNYSPGYHTVNIGGVYIDYTIPSSGIQSDTNVIYYIGNTKYIDTQSENAIIIHTSNEENAATQIGTGLNDLINEAFASYEKENPGLQNYAGWSRDAKLALKSAANYIKKNPDCPPQVVYSLDWGSNMGVDGGDGATNAFSLENPDQRGYVETLKSNGGTLVLVEPRSTSNDGFNRLTQIQIKNKQGEITPGFYIPTQAINIHDETKLKVVLCTYESLGEVDHQNGVVALTDYITPSLFNKQETELNTDTNNKYEWYILEDGGIVRKISFAEYLDYAYAYTPAETKGNAASNNSGDEISIKYYFVNSHMSNIFETLKNSKIAKGSNVATSSDGLATFTVINNAFNNYSNMTIDFISKIGTTYNNVLQIADSMYNLDSELAGDASALNGFLAQIENQDLISVNTYFTNNTFDSATAFDISDNDELIKLSKESLLAALSNNNVILNTIFQDIADTNNINQAIQNFINDSSNNLQGEVWDKVRSKFLEYSEICNKKVNYANTLIDAIKSSYQKLLDYLDDYDELDTSKIPEVEKSIKEIEMQITNLENQYTTLSDENGKTYDVCDDKGNVVSSYTIDNSIQMKAVNELIEICTKTKTELNKILEKLNGLAAADQSAANVITETITEAPVIETPNTTPYVENPVPTPPTPAINNPTIDDSTATDSLSTPPSSETTDFDKTSETGISPGTDPTPYVENPVPTPPAPAINTPAIDDPTVTDSLSTPSSSETTDFDKTSETGISLGTDQTADEIPQI